MPISRTGAIAPTLRVEEKDCPEKDGENAARGRQPFAFDFVAQPDCGNDLLDAGDKRPCSDEVNDHEQGEAWPEDGDRADDDPGDSFQEQQPPSGVQRFPFEGKSARL